MSAPQIIVVDIEEELMAEKRGECLSCRTLCTHLASKKCANTFANNEMNYCKKCNHFYCKLWFNECPICTEE
jgi:hypothetical protein